MTRDPARRAEWLLMYRRGLEAADIARICHTLPHVAAAFIHEQVTNDPGLLDQRLCRCLEPSLPVFRDENANGGWNGNALSLALFVDAHGRLPRRSANTSTTAGALEVFLYHWVRAQRRSAAEGNLLGPRERQLETIPGWTVLTRDQMHTKHWDERLAACVAFHDKHGHEPSYRTGTTGLERALGLWLNRQRSRAHRGVLPALRATDLRKHFPEPEPPDRLEHGWRPLNHGECGLATRE